MVVTIEAIADELCFSAKNEGAGTVADELVAIEAATVNSAHRCTHIVANDDVAVKANIFCVANRSTNQV